MVVMSVGQHDRAQVSAPEAELGECRCQVVLATWDPGVDHGQLRTVLPQVHLAKYQPDQMKLCTQLGDLHNRQRSPIVRCDSPGVRAKRT